MKIYLAQDTPIVGGLEYNYQSICQHYNKSLELGCDVCVLPELFLCGYTPSDLLLKHSFINKITRYIDKLSNITTQTVLLLPTPYLINGKVYNAVLGLQNGSVIGISLKKNLPNYGVFDEKRYFSSGDPSIISINGVKVGVVICEDLWTPEIVSNLKHDGAEVIISINASPFEIGKLSRRLDVVQSRWKESQLPILYCNQALGLDGVVYDGSTFAYDGEVKVAMKPFEGSSIIIDFHEKQFSKSTIHSYTEIDMVYGAIVFGLREYFERTGFKSCVIGLSGGIDSALVAAIASDALGPENVLVVMMPSKFTSKSSVDDAAEFLKRNPKILSKTISIEEILDASVKSISDLSQIAYENLQARIRGNILMSISNTEDRLLLTTGNKSEIATGYSTLYGDMCGAFNPIKDVYKTNVIDLSNWRNKNLPQSIKISNDSLNVIPEKIILKEPTAELRENQKDTDALPRYEILDKILHMYIEENLDEEDIINAGFECDVVKKVIKLVNLSEYKRWQAAPGVKITNQSFIKDRRYPISISYDKNSSI